jgi:hypothetical protein
LRSGTQRIDRRSHTFPSLRCIAIYLGLKLFNPPGLMRLMASTAMPVFGILKSMLCILLATVLAATATLIWGGASAGLRRTPGLGLEAGSIQTHRQIGQSIPQITGQLWI